MKNILTLFFAVVFPFMSFGQSDSLLERFYAGVEDSCLEVEYAYSVRLAGVMNNGSGVLASQGAMWTHKGNGVEMYCDSSVLWIVDASAKEVVIEPAATEASTAFINNPALIFSELEDAFSVTESRMLADGQTRLYVLRPRSDIGIDYFNIELNADAIVKRASFALSDGNLVKIEVSSMKLTPMVPVEAFRPKTVFDSKWIVTDLR